MRTEYLQGQWATVMADDTDSLVSLRFILAICDYFFLKNFVDFLWDFLWFLGVIEHDSDELFIESAVDFELICCYFDRCYDGINNKAKDW